MSDREPDGSYAVRVPLTQRELTVLLRLMRVTLAAYEPLEGSALYQKLKAAQAK